MTYSPSRLRLVRGPLLLPLAAAALAAAPLLAQHLTARSAAAAADSLPTTRLSANTYLVATPTGNVVVSAAAGGTLVVGVQAASLTPRLRQAVARLGAAPVRYVIATAGRTATTDGAAGWGKAGALVLMHENLARAMRHAAGATPVAPAALPRAGFSDVVQLFLDDEEVHAVHQPAGYSDADVSVHLERANVLYLGNGFTSDGYPAIDLEHGGSIAGLVEEATKFVDFPATMQIVPGRGPVATTRDLRAYRDMLAGVRDRVAPLVKAGRSLSAVAATHPTAAWDARWGHGPVSAGDFVAAVYHSLGGR